MRYRLEDLQKQLLVETDGESLAYLTDFLLTESTVDSVAGMIHGCDTVICEAQYRNEDLELARRNFHLTSRQAAELAARAQARRLLLFHLSDRYEVEEWLAMLEEARSVFPPTEFPPEWDIGSEATGGGETSW